MGHTSTLVASVQRRMLRTLAAAALAAALSLPALAGSDTASPGGPLARTDARAQLPPGYRAVPALPRHEGLGTRRLVSLTPQQAAQTVERNLRSRRVAVSPAPVSRGARDRIGEGRVGVGGREEDPSTRPQAVFGADLRRRINDTTIYPYSTVCKIFVTYPSGNTYVATGAMVDRSYMLTGGQVVYDYAEGGWATEMEVYPGLDGDYAPYGGAYGINLRTFRGWTDTGGFDWDMALVTLDYPIGRDCGWLGFSAYRNVNGFTGNLSGYPTDIEDGFGQYYDYGRINGSTRRQVYHRIDTEGGTAGAPIYAIERSRRYIFATNSWETASSNGGCRIDPDKFSSLVRWIYSRR